MNFFKVCFLYIFKDFVGIIWTRIVRVWLHSRTWSSMARQSLMWPLFFHRKIFLFGPVSQQVKLFDLCIFNRFVNEIFVNLFFETFGRRWYFFWFLTKKISKNVYFLLQNKHLKLKIDCKTMKNGNFKHVFLRTMILHLQTY